MKKILLLVLILLATIQLFSQEKDSAQCACPVSISTGLDIVSSYNWRGIDFGNSPSLQPYIGLNAYGFDFSLWGSMALIANETIDDKKVPFNEIDMILKYSYEIGAGTLSTEIVDFYYPYLNIDYSNFDGVEDGVSQGAHWISWAIGYDGPESFPISAKIDYNIHNDPNNSIYFELGYGLNIDKTKLDLFVGFAKGKDGSSLYNIKTDKLEFVNVGGTVSKSIKVTENFSLPVSTQFVVNPRLNKAHLIFKVSL